MEITISILVIWTVVNTICIIGLVVKVGILKRKIKDNHSDIIDNRKFIDNNSILIEKISEIIKEHTDDIKRIVIILPSHINNGGKHN